MGSKTVGIAISDLMGWTAQGLDTLRINEEQNELGIEKLVEIIQDNQVGTVVIGLPKNMNNSIDFVVRLRYNTRRSFKKPYHP